MTPRVKEFDALRRGGNSRDSAVGRIRRALDQPYPLELFDEARDRGRSHLLGDRQGAKGDRTAEDNHRQRRKLRRREAGGIVLTSKPTEEMDRGGMEAIGQFARGAGRRPGLLGRRGRGRHCLYLAQLSSIVLVVSWTN